nr:hypothetical protein [Mycobacterium sp. UM_NZ2]
MERQVFGELAVFMATHDDAGKRLPKSQRHPLIADGRGGELYVGDSAGARELAADLLAAADAYDALVAAQALQ